ncbi:unnamed protein product [Absidia cylindrospora]
MLSEHYLKQFKSRKRGFGDYINELQGNGALSNQPFIIKPLGGILDKSSPRRKSTTTTVSPNIASASPDDSIHFSFGSPVQDRRTRTQEQRTVSHPADQPLQQQKRSKHPPLHRVQHHVSPSSPSLSFQGLLEQPQSLPRPSPPLPSNRQDQHNQELRHNTAQFGESKQLDRKDDKQSYWPAAKRRKSPSLPETLFQAEQQKPTSSESISTPVQQKSPSPPKSISTPEHQKSLSPPKSISTPEHQKSPSSPKTISTPEQQRSLSPLKSIPPLGQQKPLSSSKSAPLPEQQKSPAPVSPTIATEVKSANAPSVSNTIHKPSPPPPPPVTGSMNDDNDVFDFYDDYLDLDQNHDDSITPEKQHTTATQDQIEGNEWAYDDIPMEEQHSQSSRHVEKTAQIEPANEKEDSGGNKVSVPQAGGDNLVDLGDALNPQEDEGDVTLSTPMQLYGVALTSEQLDTIPDLRKKLEKKLSGDIRESLVFCNPLPDDRSLLDIEEIVSFCKEKRLNVLRCLQSMEDDEFMAASSAISKATQEFV